MHMESTLGGSTTFRARGDLHAGGGDARGTFIERPDIEQPEPSTMQGYLAAIMAENRELRAQLEQLRSERARMADILDRLAEVLGSKSTDKLVHDVRNVLNERELYRALADTAM